jgi:hypothetical protein
LFPADVPESHPFFRFIQRLGELGITSGCATGAFCPDAPITAGQLAVFVVRGLAGGDSLEHPTAPYFSDVPATHPFFRHVQKLRAIGAWDGCGGAWFCPDHAVTRAQAAAIILRALLDAPRENGQCTLSCDRHPCGSGDGCGATCATGSGCVIPSTDRPAASTPLVPPTIPMDDSLASNRSRLFHWMASTAAPGAWTCSTWYGMSRSEQNIFLTITDRLQRTRLADGRSALSHVNKIYAVRGHERDAGSTSRPTTGSTPRSGSSGATAGRCTSTGSRRSATMRSAGDIPRTWREPTPRSARASRRIAVAPALRSTSSPTRSPARASSRRVRASPE